MSEPFDFERVLAELALYGYRLLRGDLLDFEERSKVKRLLDS